MSTTTKQQRLDNLINQVREVAIEIEFRPPRRGERSMLRVLAATLDYRGIRPIKTTGNAKVSWLTANRYGEIHTDRLLQILKRHLPELLTQDSPIIANPVSKPASVSNSPKLDIRQLDTELDTPKLDKPERKAVNIAGWTIRQDAKGFYRAFRTISGKTKCVCLGKSLDGAPEKLQH